MYIIIRNGIIQKDEAKRIQDIKNDEGLLKKDYSNYIKGTPGPYYDFLECHLHVPRFPKDIPNFHGPQNSKKIKLDFRDFSQNNKYCCICHELIKSNPSFPPRKTYFEPIDSDDYKYKLNDNNKKQVIKVKINSTITDLKTLFIKFTHKMCLEKIREDSDYYKRKSIKIISIYYKIFYKILYKPILYHISLKETKVLWPWELTNYQKFKLLNPKYKELCIFPNNNFDKFRTNYVIID